MRGLEPVSFYPAQGVCFRSSSWTSLTAMTSRDEAHPGTRASRPHNTGKASPISSTRVDRQRRQDSASAGPMPFPLAGWPVAPSRGNRASPNGGACGRDARAPGWAPLPIALAPRGGVRRRGGLQPCRCGRAVPLRGPSSFFVCLRGSLFFFCFKQAGLPGRPTPLMAIARSHAKMLIRKGY